jgi:hypothetical protein
MNSNINKEEIDSHGMNSNINKEEIDSHGMNSKDTICRCCNKSLFTDAHSNITNYPIDYNTFPLVKNCEIHKIELCENQYLFIPENWFHWVFTEPNTLSVHYEINNINFIDDNNNFYKSIKYSEPFLNEFNSKYNIKHMDFINKSLNHSYRATFSDTDDCIPVQKKQTKKFFHSNTLANIIDINITNNYHTYVGNNKIDSDNIMNNFRSINDIIDPNFHNDISYVPSVWFTLNKRVNSGLHYDPTPNLIYIVDGKKTIYLFPPSCYNNLYIEEYPLIKTIN